jgi:hypothetical protein
MVTNIFKTLLVGLSLSLALSIAAQTNHALDIVSPKLRDFLVHNGKAYEVFTNCLNQAFSNRRLELYYFYSNNESKPRASHYYKDETTVCVVIRENQLPLDEYICLVFELINSMSESQFSELISRARTGDISKDDFAREMSRTEFLAIKRTRDVLKDIVIAKGKIRESYYYKRFIECPDSFADFMVYRRSIASPHRDAMNEWREKYEFLRQR